jgi:hypothetical protein
MLISSNQSKEISTNWESTHGSLGVEYVRYMGEPDAYREPILALNPKYKNYLLSPTYPVETSAH